MFRGPIALATIRTSLVLGFRLFVQAGTLLLVTRMLGPERFGAFAGVAALAVVLGTLSSFGTHLVLLGAISKDPTQRISVLRYALPTTLLCGVVLLVAFLLICALVLHSSGVHWSVLLAIGAAEMVLLPLVGLVTAELLALECTARSQVLQTLPLVLRLLAAALVFWQAPAEPLTIYGYAYCIATAIPLALVMVCMPEPWPALSMWRRPTSRELRESVGYAALNITAMAPAELDKTLASKLMPLSAAGLYAAASRIVGAVTLPVIALMLAALPRLFRASTTQSRGSARLLRWVFGVTALYSTALAVMLWWCAPLFVWLLGEHYDGVDDVIRWLCFAIPGMALRLAAGSALMAQGRSWWRVGYESVGLVVLAVAAIVFTTSLGGHSMPLALVCSEWSMALLGGWLVVRMHRRRSCLAIL